MYTNNCGFFFQGTYNKNKGDGTCVQAASVRQYLLCPIRGNKNHRDVYNRLGPLWEERSLGKLGGVFIEHSRGRYFNAHDTLKVFYVPRTMLKVLQYFILFHFI